MRKILVLMALISPAAMAKAIIEVEPNAFMRLPGNATVLQLDEVNVADNATLMLPAALRELTILELHLGRSARLVIAPSEQPLKLDIAQADIASGAAISARGGQGTFDKPATAGRQLNLRLQGGNVQDLLVDARGGNGAPGYSGLAGADGVAGGCTWGQASRGHNGLDGGNGAPGATGGQVRLELPQGFALEQIKVRVDGGAGGKAGLAGEPGKGGARKGCLVYSAAGAADGRPGLSGQPGEPGPAGSVNVVQF
ncbi:collagen-like protein [Pseudomonas sp. 5P_3.1_Bac2]|uniref:collagen-like protein n=1 Tax=Pseudomonas sp. 5P_3.1_Bac2 TaxID=2971617 RepID=UPI0021CAD8BE|nr:collagen-like protein [Pseudomonas sp. 5P_3.1_Bac2]MCU1716089.1 collagen-like protein [Pseudomonas sp. 5P_3.1_Bac2]